MKEIGGYFNLELSANNNTFPHSGGIWLNSGRCALELILQSIDQIKRVYIPYYTCDVILEPIDKLRIPYTFYRINEQLELAEEIILSENEYLLYTNYFGIKDDYIKKLTQNYQSKLIVDNAQSLFTEPITGINTMYSPRKFVGIPDGGIAYVTNSISTTDLEKDQSYDRCSHLLKRIDLGASEGYVDFKKNSRKLKHQPIRLMSDLTRTLLSSIDFEKIKYRRKENFSILHKALKDSNRLVIPPIDSFACPMVYPYYTERAELREQLVSNNIFTATYWPNVFEWTEKSSLEYELTDKIIAIPIDQRYGEEEMKSIIRLINNHI